MFKQFNSKHTQRQHTAPPLYDPPFGVLDLQGAIYGGESYDVPHNEQPSNKKIMPTSERSYNTGFIWGEGVLWPKKTITNSTPQKRNKQYVHQDEHAMANPPPVQAGGQANAVWPYDRCCLKLCHASWSLNPCPGRSIKFPWGNR